MVLANTSSIFSQVFISYTTNVFGSNIITTLLMFLLFFIIGLLVKIPLSINLMLYIPLSIILMAMGFLPVYAGVTLVVILMIATGVSLVNSF